ncbi:hypothetical protein [Niabella ginsengisoli]|uniref:DUF3857 domain-containing protein n=1 Tax=Niabella ginsengisoli TaxID=522298 RepID=A0ABS9SQW9_9BACT|nr:hypothetical protein [Niabella ginsengisoli]MCH5600514.1 hypothetical protein [Niabella ginsengisoli]
MSSKNALFVVGRNKNYTIPPAKAQQLIQQSSKQDFSKYVSLELIHLEKNYSVEQLPVPRYALNEIYYFNDKYITVNNRYNKYITDTIAYYLNVVEDDKIVRSYFPFINLPKLWPFYESVDIAIDNTQSDTTLYITRQFDNTVYALNPDSLYTRYPFVFPADKTMPASFQSTLFKNNIDFNTAKNKNNKVISSFYNVLKHQHILFSPPIRFLMKGKIFFSTLSIKNFMILVR